MMKKLLVILVVLGVVSVAGANMTMNILNSTISVGGVTIVEIIQTAPNPTGSGGLMEIDLVSTGGTGSVGTPWNRTTGFAVGPPGTANGEPVKGWMWMVDGGAYITPADTFGFGKTAQMGYGTYGLGSISLMMNSYDYTVSFVVTGLTPGTIDLTWGGIWDSVDLTGIVGGTITVTPEPMTMALLGLGGLFLRRRHRS